MTRKILIVDDDRDIRRHLTELFELEGYKVQVATNGQEALDMLQRTSRENLPNIILLDIMMPIMDGLTLVKLLNAEETLRHLPVLLTTARSTHFPETNLANIKGHVPKPFDVDELIAMVETHS